MKIDMFVNKYFGKIRRKIERHHCIHSFRKWTVAGLIALAMVLSLYPADQALANNLVISDVKVKDWDTTANTTQVEFDLTWNNSWRDATHYDAVWIFVKYTTDDGVTWHHATMRTSGTNPDGFSKGSIGNDAEIVVPADKKGCFIQRATQTSGTFNSTDMQLVWDYGADGLSDEDVSAITTKVSVFGCEMVYIPSGSFYAGDTSSVAAFQEGSADTDPWNITSEDEISVTNAASNGFYYTSGGATGEDVTGATFAIPAEFPKGYNGFYLMKYELSQKQYRDFLNTLTRDQQNNRISSQAAGYFTMSNTATEQTRNGIRNPFVIPSGAITFHSDLYSDTHLDQPDDGEWIAANYLSWMDLCAFADWAGLRPMTELEYEKAARGTNAAVSGEYAWGNTTLETAATSLSGEGTLDEAPDQGNLNYVATALGGPFRVGSFADASSTRQNAGSGYYGALDLSGNLWEHMATVGNAAGRAFTGTHGDGALSANGYATNADWPGSDSGEVTGATGSGLRGGSFEDNANAAQISNRQVAASANAGRGSGFGGRLARTVSS